jgi:CRISPR type I-E-associated protein CasB/Cse2
MTSTPKQETPSQVHPAASAVFQRLEERASADTAVVAALRRSAAYEPGLYPPVFPYVEPITHGRSEWQRQATYLAAACWAKSRRQRDGSQQGNGQLLAVGLRKLGQDPANSHAGKNIEKRFTTASAPDHRSIRCGLNLNRLASPACRSLALESSRSLRAGALGSAVLGAG